MVNQPLHIETVTPDSQIYDDVLELHRRHKRWLGPLPFEAFHVAANKGTLLAAVIDDHVVGYVLYRLPDTTVALTHLCVNDESRGLGVARALVDELERRHPSRRGIRLRCRRDWPAATLWPRLDFEPIGDRMGRSIEGHLLTSWWRDFGHPNLFSIPPDTSRPLAALDTDVFLDLIDARMQHAESQTILTDLVLDAFQPVITKQVLLDINNQRDEQVRNRHLSNASSYKRVDGRALVWRRNVSEMAGDVGTPRNPHDLSDLHHVCRAAAAGARFFVTRDRRLRGKLAASADARLGLQVISPADLARIAHQERVGTYEFAAVQGTAFLTRAVTTAESGGVLDSFIDHPQGERRTTFRTRVQPLLAEPSLWQVELCRDDHDQPVAVVGYGVHDGQLNVPLFRASGGAAATVARQLAFRLREAAQRSRVRWIHVSDPNLSSQVRTALLDEGFMDIETGLVALTADHAGTIAGAHRLLSAGPLPATSRPVVEQVLQGLDSARSSAWSAADLERTCWPLKLLDSTLSSVLLPIRPSWAEALFDVGLNEATLFPRPTGLGMSREHVYYRSPVPVGPLQAPARLAWYVSGPVSAIRAVSQLSEVVVDRAEVLYRRFEHLGVYSFRDVQQAAGTSGQAMALRFTNTELLAAPISLAQLRSLANSLDSHTPLLRSAWRMPPGLFRAIYTKGQVER